MACLPKKFEELHRSSVFYPLFAEYDANKKIDEEKTKKNLALICSLKVSEAGGNLTGDNFDHDAEGNLIYFRPKKTKHGIIYEDAKGMGGEFLHLVYKSNLPDGPSIDRYVHYTQAYQPLVEKSKTDDTVYESKWDELGLMTSVLAVCYENTYQEMGYISGLIQQSEDFNTEVARLNNAYKRFSLQQTNFDTSTSNSLLAYRDLESLLRLGILPTQRTFVTGIEIQPLVAVTDIEASNPDWVQMFAVYPDLNNPKGNWLAIAMNKGARDNYPKDFQVNKTAFYRQVYGMDKPPPLPQPDTVVDPQLQHAYKMHDCIMSHISTPAKVGDMFTHVGYGWQGKLGRPRNVYGSKLVGDRYDIDRNSHIATPSGSAPSTGDQKGRHMSFEFDLARMSKKSSLEEIQENELDVWLSRDELGDIIEALRMTIDNINNRNSGVTSLITNGNNELQQNYNIATNMLESHEESQMRTTRNTAR